MVEIGCFIWCGIYHSKKKIFFKDNGAKWTAPAIVFDVAITRKIT